MNFEKNIFRIGDVAGGRGCGRKYVFFSSKFQKIVIIPKNINLEKNNRKGCVAKRRGCGRKGGEGGFKNYKKYFFSQNFKKSS